MSGFSQFTRAPRLDEFTSDYVQFQAGRRTYPNANGVFQPMGVLYTTTAASALGTGTDEQTLATFTLPANGLDIAGRKIRIRSSWQTAANTHAKICKVYFGLSAISTGSVTASGASPMLELTVTMADTQDRARIWGWGFGGTDGVTLVRYANVLIGGMGSTIEIKATGQTDTSAASDITLVDFSIEYMN